MPTTIKSAAVSQCSVCWLVTSSVHSGHVARQPVARPGATCRQLKEAALVSWSVGPPRPAPAAADRPATPGRSSEQLVRGGRGRR